MFETSLLTLRTAYVVEGPTFNRMLAIVVGEAEKAKAPQISQDIKAKTTEPKSATLPRKPSLTKTKIARKITSQEAKVEDTVNTDDDEEEGDKRAREPDGDADKGDDNPSTFSYFQYFRPRWLKCDLLCRRLPLW